MPSNGSTKASQQLSNLRKAVANLSAIDVKGAATVADLKEFLDELQETVDSAAQAEQAVREASVIRAQAQKAAAVGGVVSVGPDGSTTQIGFGKPTVATSPASAAYNPWANNASPKTAEASPKQMMVVKKKKKKRQPLTTEAGAVDGDKKPAGTDVAGPTAKRAKAE